MSTASLGSSRPSLHRGLRQQTCRAFGPSMAHPEMARPLAFVRRSFGGVGGAEGHWYAPTPPAECDVLEPFFVSTGLVAVAEIGDKTQLLALVLAARFRKPAPILAGILVATLANHALAAAVGATVGALFQGPWMKWVLGLAFLAFAGWALIPDKFEDDDHPPERPGRSVFLATAIAFFFVEMGDKTQVATAALAARFQDVVVVAAGTTIGMMIANAPVVLIGGQAASRLPLKWIRLAAAASFAAIGVWILVAG
jgi:Ca2+/H+ antiporter, TMEM165/GDT1 family